MLVAEVPQVVARLFSAWWARGPWLPCGQDSTVAAAARSSTRAAASGAIVWCGWVGKAASRGNRNSRCGPCGSGPNERPSAKCLLRAAAAAVGCCLAPGRTLDRVCCWLRMTPTPPFCTVLAAVHSVLGAGRVLVPKISRAASRELSIHRSDRQTNTAGLRKLSMGFRMAVLENGLLNERAGYSEPSAGCWLG